MSDLDQIPPEHGVDLYIESRKDDTASSTRVSHRSRLRPFLEWCEEEGEIETLDQLDDIDARQGRLEDEQ